MEEIRPMTDEDLDFAVRITHREGWGYDRADFQRILQWDPEGSFVLESKGRRVGMATTFFYDSFGWIGNVVVEKDFRGRGLGTRIVKRCISHIMARGAAGVRLFAYENTRSFYLNFGFRHEGAVIVLRRSPSPVEAIPVPEGYSLRKIGDRDLEEVCELDATVFGGDRSHVLETILSLNPGLSMGLWKEGSLRAMIMSKRVMGNIEIGPWETIERDDQPALGLFDQLASENETSYFMGIPEKREAVLEPMVGRGFNRIDRIHAMVLGDPPPTDYDRVLGVGALEKG